MPDVVIIGAGQAGAETATALRQQGFAGSITLLGDESHPPYRRPPLSKTFLSGEAALESLYLRPEAAYARANVDLRCAARVDGIDRAARRVLLSDGASLPYNKLVLATGGSARRLAIPGDAGKHNLHVLRSVADVQRIREYLAPGKRLTVIGGGYIGLEAAAVAVSLGVRVTVLEAAPRLLVRVAAPELSEYYHAFHTGRGVDIRVGAGVERFEGTAGRIETVCCADGTRIDTDVVIAGVGLAPNVQLAVTAGLAVDNGIMVDEFAQTSDPDIYAAGDCAELPSAFLGRRVRLESVQNAIEQGRAVAAGLCGNAKSYDPVPWFWSDQYHLKLQMVGMPQDYDRVVTRGSRAEHSFAIFYLRDGGIIGAETVNRPQEFMLARQLVAKRARLDPARLADDALPLKSLLTA